MRGWANACINYWKHLLMLVPPFFSKQLYSGKLWECQRPWKCADRLTAQELPTLASRALKCGELCLSPTNSNLKPCIWLLAGGTHCPPTGPQEAEVLPSKRVSSLWDVCSTTAAGTIKACSTDTHFCTSQSHPNKLGLSFKLSVSQNYISALTWAGTLYEQVAIYILQHTSS